MLSYFNETPTKLLLNKKLLHIQLQQFTIVLCDINHTHHSFSFLFFSAFHIVTDNTQWWSLPSDFIMVFNHLFKWYQRYSFFLNSIKKNHTPSTVFFTFSFLLILLFSNAAAIVLRMKSETKRILLFCLFFLWLCALTTITNKIQWKTWHFPRFSVCTKCSLLRITIGSLSFVQQCAVPILYCINKKKWRKKRKNP